MTTDMPSPDRSEPPGPIQTAVPASGSGPPMTAKAPALAMWICLILSWIFLALPVPFTVVLGVPFGFAGLVLAIVCLVRGAILHGVLGLFGAFVVAPVCYVIGVAMMGMLMAGMSAA